MASDQDRFDTAYEAFRGLAEGLHDIDFTRYSRGVTSEDAPSVLLHNWQEKLQELVHLPRTWPLARLTIPLAGLSKQIDRLLEGYGMVKLSRQLTPKFWILPLYRELLNSARRIRPSAASERARSCTGLVKLICKENKEQRGKREFHAGTPHPNDRGGFTQWFGSCSLITLRNCQVTDTKPCFLAPKMGSLLCPFCWHLPRGARMAGPPPKNSWDCQFPTMPLTQRINDIPITLRTIPMMVKKTHPTQICTDEALNEQLPSKKTFTYISFCQFGKHVAFGTL